MVGPDARQLVRNAQGVPHQGDSTYCTSTGGAISIHTYVHIYEHVTGSIGTPLSEWPLIKSNSPALFIVDMRPKSCCCIPDKCWKRSCSHCYRCGYAEMHLPLHSARHSSRLAIPFKGAITSTPAFLAQVSVVRPTHLAANSWPSSNTLCTHTHTHTAYKGGGAGRSIQTRGSKVQRATGCHKRVQGAKSCQVAQWEYLNRRSLEKWNKWNKKFEQFYISIFLYN